MEHSSLLVCSSVQELSQESRDTLKKLFETAHKVMAYCVLYMAQHVPRQDPKVLSLDCATPAGRLAVAKRYRMLMRCAIPASDESIACVQRFCSDVHYFPLLARYDAAVPLE